MPDLHGNRDHDIGMQKVLEEIGESVDDALQHNGAVVGEKANLEERHAEEGGYGDERGRV